MKRSPKLTNDKCGKIVNARSKAEGSKWDTKIHPGSGMNYYDLRYKTGVAVVEDGHTVTEVCRMFGLSRSFVSKWSRIYFARKTANKWKEMENKPVKMTVFKSHTNRPKKIRRPVQNEIRDSVVKRRKKFPFEGAFRIKAATGVKASPTTINKVLRSEKLLDLPKTRCRGKTYGRFQRPWVMNLVQTDYKTWSRGIKSIWILDDCSRMILAHRIVSNSSAETVIDLLRDVIATYGAPKQILSDHGTEFYSVTGGKGASALDKFCEENGIRHVMGRVRHPETQGKMERTHRSAAEEVLAFGKIDTLEEAKETFARWVQYYNWERPHQALNYIAPGEYFMSMHSTNLEEICAF